jgi:hypothetical protein
MGKLPKLKHPPLPPPPRLRVAAPPVVAPPAKETLRVSAEDLWALEKAMLIAEKAEVEKSYALAKRALLLVQLDIGGKITAAEREAAAAEKLIAKQREEYQSRIESIRVKLGITGAFEFDSESGVITAGTTPAPQKE